MDGCNDYIARNWSLSRIITILCWCLFIQNVLSENVGNVSTSSDNNILADNDSDSTVDDTKQRMATTALQGLRGLDSWKRDSDDYPKLCPQNCWARKCHPNPVFLWAKIHSMALSSESDMVTLHQLWWDDRYLRQSTDMGNEFIPLNVDVFDHFWKPDTYFRNSIVSNIHQVTNPNIIILVRDATSFILKIRLNFQFRCPMKLHKFPMDEHICTVILSSYSHKAEEMRYCWHSGFLNITSQEFKDLMVHSQFVVVRHRMRHLESIHKSGNISEAHLDIHVKRQAGYYYIQVYVPCCLMVVTSWVSFWINREATGDRVGLGITSILTLSTFVAETRKDLPEVDYPTALDVYILICFTFVIASVFEFAGVHYFTKTGSEDGFEFYDTNQFDGGTFWEINEQSHPQDVEHVYSQVTADIPLNLLSSAMAPTKGGGKILPPTTAPLATYESHSRRTGNCCMNCLCCILGSEKFRANRILGAKGPNSVSKIDKVSRILFPLSFVVINVIYWYTYTASEIVDDYNENWVDDKGSIKGLRCIL